MLFLCVKDQYTRGDRGFLEGNSYTGHYVGSSGHTINFTCPEMDAITTYDKQILAIMVEDPENEEKH